MGSGHKKGVKMRCKVCGEEGHTSPRHRQKEPAPKPRQPLYPSWRPPEPKAAPAPRYEAPPRSQIEAAERRGILLCVEWVDWYGTDDDPREGLFDEMAEAVRALQKLRRG